MRVSLLMLIVLSWPLHAAIDAYPFPNEEMQVRYDNLIAELRCPQCLNTNLAGSDAMIAQDLRREVHRMLLEGYSDEDILEFMYERYGDFILYRPRLGVGTMVLWFAPVVLLLLAAFVWFRFVRASGQTSDKTLTADEQQKLDQLLQQDR